MLKNPQLSREKYRTERSSELCAAVDITPYRISVVFYDLALSRRYARTSLCGEHITCDNVASQLSRLFSLSGKEYGIPASALKKIGFAAPVHLSCFIEEKLSPVELYLRPETELFVMPYISAEISGRFTASLLALPDGDCLAADFADKLYIAQVKDGVPRCAAFPLAGAFDGTALEGGMSAERGAIDEVKRESEGALCYGVVGDSESVGIAPSGAFSAASLMLGEGIIDSDGIMTDRDLLYIGEDFFISQSDVRAIQTDRARCEAAFEVFCGEDSVPKYLSGDVFAANGARALLKLRALPEEFSKAGFAGNSVEQGIIRCLESEDELSRALTFAMTAEDVTEQYLQRFHEISVEKYSFS